MGRVEVFGLGLAPDTPYKRCGHIPSALGFSLLAGTAGTHGVSAVGEQTCSRSPTWLCVLIVCVCNGRKLLLASSVIMAYYYTCQKAEMGVSEMGVLTAPFIPTNHPSFCLIIKQKYCLSHQKIAKSLFFVLTCDASCP